MKFVLSSFLKLAQKDLHSNVYTIYQLFYESITFTAKNSKVAAHITRILYGPIISYIYKFYFELL